MGLLDGEIAQIVGDALESAGMTLPVTLTKSTSGTRTPGAASGGTNPTTISYTAQGLVASTEGLRRSGSLIAGVDRVIRIFGSSISGGVVPTPGDRITIEGTTSTIVGDSGGMRAVQRDPAGASYLCQCRS